MEVSADLAKMEEQQQSPRRRQKGGLMTMPFIIGTHFDPTPPSIHTCSSINHAHTYTCNKSQKN